MRCYASCPEVCDCVALRRLDGFGRCTSSTGSTAPWRPPSSEAQPTLAGLTDSPRSPSPDAARRHPARPRPYSTRERQAAARCSVRDPVQSRIAGSRVPGPRVCAALRQAAGNCGPSAPPAPAASTARGPRRGPPADAGRAAARQAERVCDRPCVPAAGSRCPGPMPERRLAGPVRVFFPLPEISEKCSIHSTDDGWP